MKRFIMTACVLLILPGLASASIIISAPTETVLDTSTTSSFTVPITFSGSYDVASYNIELLLKPESGTTGSVAFNGASGASQNYVFTQSHLGFSTTTSTATKIYGPDILLSGAETIANTTRNLITVNLNIAPGTSGKFDVILDPNFTNVANGDADLFQDVTLNSGVITISDPVVQAPEPGTLALLGIGGGAWLVRRLRTRSVRRS